MLNGASFDQNCVTVGGLNVTAVMAVCVLPLTTKIHLSVDMFKLFEQDPLASA